MNQISNGFATCYFDAEQSKWRPAREAIEPTPPPMPDLSPGTLSAALDNEATEYADTLAGIDEALSVWRTEMQIVAIAEKTAANHTQNAASALSSLSADQRQLLAESEAVHIGDSLYLVSVDADGALALRPCCPLPISSR